MKKTGLCPKCGSKDIIAKAQMDVRAQGGGPLNVATFEKPDAIIFKSRRECKVFAWVCADCGFLELYVDNPANLKPQKYGADWWASSDDPNIVK